MGLNDKIAKYGEKATAAVENFSGQATEEPGAGEHPDVPAAGAP
jgi:hypothetical protein